MTGVLIIALLWIVFGGSHLLFASEPARDALVRRFGEQRFVLVYSLFAVASFTALVVAFSLHHRQGAPGLALGRWPLVRDTLVGASFAGALLMIAGVWSYFRSPMAVFRTTLRPPRGTQRITRHPFFVGTALLMASHALLAATLAGVVFFGGFAALALAGIPLQERKLRRRYGEAYVQYAGQTSIVPFAALARGRQRLGADDQWGRVLLVSVIGALALLAMHPWLLIAYGLPIPLLVGGGGLYIVLRSRSRRPPAAARADPPAMPTK